MRASHEVAKDDIYVVLVTPATFEKNGPTSQLRLYRNRTRLNGQESAFETRWVGPLEKGDLIEADADIPITLRVGFEPTE